MLRSWATIAALAGSIFALGATRWQKKLDGK
jgi:hypothetical protein